MRLGLAVALLCGCHLYDPVDEIAYREYPDTQSAVRAILAEAGDVKVYAVGEYHPTRAGVAKRSPLARFTSEIVDLLAPHARHLVVESWLDDGCQSSGEGVGAQVAAATGRPASMGIELAILLATSAEKKIETHGLPMTCIEHGSLLDSRGRVDFLRLLELVTEKLGTAARALVARDQSVIVYGGALHNDLFPRWPLAELSYAESLSRDLDGRVLELDLVVPEVVAPMALVRAESWFPLLGRASPDRVMVWERAPMSYVVILPAQSIEVAKVALPLDLM